MITAKTGSGLTVTEILCVVAHWPLVGVNVYEPELLLLTTAGDHDPLMPFGELVKSVGDVLP